MHSLPPTNSPLREMFSVERDLIPLGTGARKPARFRDALREAQRAVASSATLEVVFIALHHNDSLVLVRVGKRGGHKCLWNFTTGKRRY